MNVFSFSSAVKTYRELINVCVLRTREGETEGRGSCWEVLAKMTAGQSSFPSFAITLLCRVKAPVMWNSDRNIGGFQRVDQLPALYARELSVCVGGGIGGGGGGRHLIYYSLRISVWRRKSAIHS